MRVRNAVLISTVAFALSVPFVIAFKNFTVGLVFWVLSIPVTLVYRHMSLVRERRQARMT